MDPTAPPPAANLPERYAREPVWAVVGASNDPAKYGNRIFRTLKAAGYRVYPINRTATTVDGDPAFARVNDLPEPPTVVDIVIPPGPDTLAVVKDAHDALASAVWFQPGAEDAAAMAWAEEHGLDVVQDCILVRHVDLRGG